VKILFAGNGLLAADRDKSFYKDIIVKKTLSEGRMEMLRMNFKRSCTVGLQACLLTMLTGFSVISTQANADPVVIEVKGREIKLNEFNQYFEVAIRMLAKQQGIAYGTQSPEQIASLRKQYLGQLGGEMALLQEAVNRNISIEDTEIDAQVADFQTALGTESLVDAGFKDEAQLRRFLTEKQMVRNLSDVLMDEIFIPAGDVITLHHDIQHELTIPEQICIRHIVVESEVEASQLLTELQAGGDFDALAKAKSTDANTAENGGDLGCFARGGMGTRSEFERVAFNTRQGELGGPVQSDFGYHVLKVYERRAARTPSLNEAYEELEKDLKHEKLPQKIMEVRQASELVTYPDRLGS